MKRLLMVLFIVLVTGCSEPNESESEIVTTTSMESVANFTIENDPSADFFFLNDVVYLRNEEIKVGMDKVGDLAGKIESMYSKGEKFTNFMSTKLPVGTEIYQIKNEVSIDHMIVKENDKLVMYTALPEG
ncbi:hypothetical protein [Aureibacillus halotolerans]|uniref:Uncharacterized protein n=1 Tax=Aureibacillus halotolerans TaxID=1508390 RepID=A0A4R6TX70_9BACI|nr:hypothetical protein [Aureibacillus halotolerans]TDQ36609.1 hypothetical protein EV213_11773 [Aureibacillus halotolerans]